MRKANIAVVIILLVCAAAAQGQSQSLSGREAGLKEPAQEQTALNAGERDAVIAELTSFYGKPPDEKIPIFLIAQDFLLTPIFSADGLLIQFAIEPKDKRNPYHGQGNDPLQQMQISHDEFDYLLWQLNSIKAFGPLVEKEDGTIRLGGRGWRTKRYQNAYLTTGELMWPPNQPPRIQFAYLYYLHKVTGLAKIPGLSRPEDADSFGLVCVDGSSYMAPKVEQLKIWSNRNQSQTVDLAGPTGDDPEGCAK
jgi:hypothetical protein